MLYSLFSNNLQFPYKTYLADCKHIFFAFVQEEHIADEKTD